MTDINDNGEETRTRSRSVRDAIAKSRTADDDIIEAGHGTLPFTMIPQWIRYGGFSAIAQVIWGHLRDALYATGSRTGVVEMDMKELAAACGVHRQTIAQHMSQLIEGRAVDAEPIPGPGRRYRYRVNTTPPDGWDGPLSIVEWRANFYGEDTSRQVKPQVKPKVEKFDIQSRKTRRSKSKNSTFTPAATSGDAGPIDSRQNTHTGSEPKTDVEPEVETDVCVSSDEDNSADEAVDARAVAVIDAIVPKPARRRYRTADRDRDARAIAALLDIGWTHDDLVAALAVTGGGGRIDESTTHPSRWIAANAAGLQGIFPPAQVAAERQRSSRAAMDDNRARADLRNALTARRSRLDDRRYLTLLDQIETATGDALADIHAELNTLVA